MSEDYNALLRREISARFRRDDGLSEQLRRQLVDRLEFAEETLRLAEELGDYVFPPWRWLGWWRRKRVVDERLAVLRATRTR